MGDDTTDLNIRVTRLETFQAGIRDDIREIRADLRTLIDRGNQQIGERRMVRALIALVSGLSGLVGGWLSHFWWFHG